jgi:hypothetical protein
MQIGFDIDYAFEGEIHKSKRNGQAIKRIAMPCPFFALSKEFAIAKKGESILSPSFFLSQQSSIGFFEGLFKQSQSFPQPHKTIFILYIPKNVGF